MADDPADPAAFFPRKPNEPILATEWNGMQVQARKELRDHTHVGGAQNGPRLTGDAIDPATSLTVKDAALSGTLAAMTARITGTLTAVDAEVTHLLKTPRLEVTSEKMGSVTVVDGLLTVNAVTVNKNVSADSLSVQTLTTEGANVSFDLAVGRTLSVAGRDLGKLVDDLAGRINSQPDYNQPTMIAMKNRHIRLRAPDDGYHDLYFSPDMITGGLVATDGPVLQGNTGGILAVARNNGADVKSVVQWTENGMFVTTARADADNSFGVYIGRPGMLEGEDAERKIVECHYGADSICGKGNLWLDTEGSGRVFLKRGFCTPGKDVAERFPAAAPLTTGDVAVYLEAAGGVAPCQCLADPRVVGIVSGAPGMVLGIEGEEPAIALCGRVPCKVDADHAPIRAGDLLVSGTTPGHAVRAPGPVPVPGTVVGKALTSLPSGRGEVLVLVGLQ